MEANEAYQLLRKFGLGDEDSRQVATSMLTKTSCSWVNNEEVNPKAIQMLNEYLASNNFSLKVSAQQVGARMQWIWDSKVILPRK